jgi:hypothetical protein
MKYCMESFLVDSKSAGSRCEEVAVLNKFTLLPLWFLHDHPNNTILLLSPASLNRSARNSY